MQQDNKIPICKSCGKPLQIETCRACHGKGSIGHSFWKHSCEWCNGSGEEYRCRDELKHLRGNFKKWNHTPIKKDSSQFKGHPIQKPFNSCPRCGGIGTIINPISKMRVPCPSCRKGQKPPPNKPPYGGAPPLGHIYWKWRR